MPEKPRLKIEDVPDFYVTETLFKKILSLSGLIKEAVLALPENAVVVEVGSGKNQEFEQGLRKLRPDIKVVSIDPTLSFNPERKDVFAKEKPDAVFYHQLKKGETLPLSIPEYRRIQTQRIKDKQEGAVAALAPYLPLKADSVDLIVDRFGPFLYLDENYLKDYIRTIASVLKPGAEARICPEGRLFKDEKGDYLFNLSDQGKAIEDFFSEFPELEISYKLKGSKTVIVIKKKTG